MLSIMSKDRALATLKLARVNAPAINSDFAVMWFQFSLHPVGRIREHSVSRENVRLRYGIVGFITLLICFAFIARHFNVTVRFFTGVSIGLLLAPYWAFGFGLDEWLRGRLRNRVALTPRLSVYPLLISSLPCRKVNFDGICSSG